MLKMVKEDDDDCAGHLHHNHESILEPDSAMIIGKEELSSDSISDNTPISPKNKSPNPVNIENKLERESDVVKMLYEKVQDLEKKQMAE